MVLIFCLDEKNGMTFNNRRQSRDCVLREKALSLAAESGKTLCMSKYSAGQFKENDNITVDNEYFLKAGKGDYCFVENYRGELLPMIKRCERVVLFKWNRRYPADRYFDVDLAEYGFALEKTEDFEGKSHDNITMEVYVKV